MDAAQLSQCRQTRLGVARRGDRAALQRQGPAGIKTRFVIGLLLLEHIFAPSDEEDRGFRRVLYRGRSVTGSSGVGHSYVLVFNSPVFRYL